MKTLVVFSVLLCCVGCGRQPAKVSETAEQVAAKAALSDIYNRDLDAARNKLTGEELDIVMARVKSNLRKIADGELKGSQITDAHREVDQLIFSFAAKR